MLDRQALDALFREARTHRAFLDEPVPEETLRAIYDLCRWGPTSGNAVPMRVLFVVSPEAKARLAPCLDPYNVEQTMKAPVTAIIAHDLDFPAWLPRLYREEDARAWYEGKPEKTAAEALRSGTLQGGYFIIAARALGLDCGPMGGFSRRKVDQTFLEGTSWRSNFLVNLGYGDPSKLRPRNARPSFEEACRIL